MWNRWACFITVPDRENLFPHFVQGISALNFHAAFPDREWKADTLIFNVKITLGPGPCFSWLLIGHWQLRLMATTVLLGDFEIPRGCGLNRSWNRTRSKIEFGYCKLQVWTQTLVWAPSHSWALRFVSVGDWCQGYRAIGFLSREQSWELKHIVIFGDWLWIIMQMLIFLICI